MKPLRGAALTALRALIEALGEVGAVPPASNHVPQNVKVVTVGQWRDYAYRMGISASDEPRARQTAFKRATEHLISERQVGFWSDHVWAVTVMDFNG